MTTRGTKSEIIYFPSVGFRNTAETLSAACTRARERGIREIIVATESGRTAIALAEEFTEGTVIAVTYHSGSGEPFDDPLPPRERKKLRRLGATIVTCGHALSGAERAISNMGGWAPLDLVSNALRMFGQGTKVAIEITLMAADAGVLSGKDVIAIGGTARGADAALVISPAHQNDMFSLRVKEIICKPRKFGRR